MLTASSGGVLATCRLNDSWRRIMHNLQNPMRMLTGPAYLDYVDIFAGKESAYSAILDLCCIIIIGTYRVVTTMGFQLFRIYPLQIHEAKLFP